MALQDEVGSLCDAGGCRRRSDAMPEPVSAVVVGSKGFLEAVEAPLRIRLGAAPHVAGNPQEVLLACGDGGRLFVLEYGGEPWIDLVKSLRVLRDGSLSIVAAVAPARAAEASGLKAAGADEVVSWEGRADPVLWAVDRVFSRGDRASPPPLPPAAAPRPAGPAPVAIAVIGLAAAVAAPAEPAEPPPLTWSAVPTGAEAEAILLAARCGKPCASAARQAAAERVLAKLSDPERAALVGAEAAVDAALLRETAALQLRLELALAVLPIAAPEVQPSAQALVADVDAVLARVKAGAAASLDAAAVLEPVRRTLVDAGIALANAASRLVAVAAPQESLAAPAPALATPAARVLSNEADVAAPPPARRKGLWIAFALAALATAGYHGQHALSRPGPSPQPRLDGAPASTLGARVRSGAVFTSEPGKPVPAAELEHFRAAEQARGNEVVEVAPGFFVSRPATAPKPPGVTP